MGIMSKLTAAYIAGLFDGEGYFGLMNVKNNGVLYVPVIKMGVTQDYIAKWLKDSYGGWIYTKRKNHKTHRAVFMWEIKGKRIEPFLRAITPYLKIKKKQAEVLIKRINLFKKVGDESVKHQLHSGWNWKYPPEIRKQLDELYLQVRKLNKRGR